MNKTYYIDISNINITEINMSLVNPQRLEKANLIADERKKIQSLISYLLLRYAFKELNINLNDYKFTYNNNKPYIKELNYYFNITHSNNIVAVIISNEEVGIDCEYIDYGRNLDNVVKYTLTDDEFNYYKKLPNEEQINYFYKKWVMKEAYFKKNAIGLTKEFKKTAINYEVFMVNDQLNNSYFISSTIKNSILLNVNLNNINK